jgi:hypothetical protein
MAISEPPVHPARRAAPGCRPSKKGKDSKIELRQLAQVTENSGKKQKEKNVSAAWKSGMRFTSGIELVEEDLRSIPKVFLIDADEVS